MPVKQCQINGVDGYKWGDAGKCYTGPSAKAKAYKKGVAIGDLSKAPVIVFDKTIPSNVIKSFMYDGFQVYIWGGNELPISSKYAFRLASETGAKDVLWGDIKNITEKRGVYMFITSDPQYKDVKGYNSFAVVSSLTSAKNRRYFISGE
jgi:hypothetical protein